MTVEEDFQLEEIDPETLCWLHEISAEEIESFPLHLSDSLTAEMNMEWSLGGMSLPSQTEPH
jgi:hypothetical protein